jgi:hypothetical protein
MNAFLNDMFGHETRREIPIYLGQGTGPRALSALNAVKNLKIVDDFI